MSSFSSFLLRFPLYDFIIRYVMSVVIIVCRSVTDGSENKRPEQKPNRNAQKTDYLNAFDSNSFANTRAKKKRYGKITPFLGRVCICWTWKMALDHICIGIFCCFICAAFHHFIWN